MSNERNTVLYIGMTNNLSRRLEEHITLKQGFVGKYACYKLVFYEEFNTPQEAIDREKQIKRWSRKKKEDLISSVNPNMESLNYSFL